MTMKASDSKIVFDAMLASHYQQGFKEFIDKNQRTWMITGAFASLDMAGPLLKFVPQPVELAVHSLNDNIDFGELLIWNNLIFVQANDSPFYKNNYHTGHPPGELKKIWRDYYYSAMYLSVRHAVESGCRNVIFHSPSTNTGCSNWPRWLWEICCETTVIVSREYNEILTICDLGQHKKQIEVGPSMPTEITFKFPVTKIYDEETIRIRFVPSSNFGKMI